MNFITTEQRDHEDLSGDALCIVYSLTCSEIKVEDHRSLNTYGIGIELTKTLPCGEKTVESQSICDISTDFERISRLYELMIDGVVTPTTLHDIAEDFIAL